MFNDEKKDKKKNLIMVIIVFLTMAGMIVLDVVSKWRNSVKYREWLKQENERKFFNEFSY